MIRRALAALLAALAIAGCNPAQWDADHPATAQSTVDAEQARQRLTGLEIREPGSLTGYDRSLFPHWSIITGTCDARETVLKVQGDGVRTDSKCEAISGSWTSPYDGATWTDPADVDIDHLIPLAEAWRSGAAEWTVAKRKLFANDLNSPQLIAVTDNVNQAKGDQPPGQWKPPLRSYWCPYAADWIAVKDAWDLTVTSAEVTALGDMLNTCKGGA